MLCAGGVCVRVFAKKWFLSGRCNYLFSGQLNGRGKPVYPLKVGTADLKINQSINTKQADHPKMMCMVLDTAAADVPIRLVILPSWIEERDKVYNSGDMKIWPQAVSSDKSIKESHVLLTEEVSAKDNENYVVSWWMPLKNVFCPSSFPCFLKSGVNW